MHKIKVICKLNYFNADLLNNFLLILTAVTTGLMAGLFYSFTVSVMPGLKRLSDNEFITVMQSINASIQNLLFFISFLGAPVFLLVSVFLHSEEPSNAKFVLLLISAIIYLTGVFGVTIFGNIPLNKELERFKISSASQIEITSQRKLFEKPWNRLNTVRTIASIISFILVIAACILNF